MGGANSWRTVIDGDDWMRSQEKRLLHEERRPSIGQASDVLGPGFASTAVPLDDWSSPETVFNGFWWSAPGAANAPNGTDAFFGHTIMQSDGSGVEVVYSETNPPVVYVRDVTVDVSGTRFWGSWAPITGGGGGGTPTGPAGGSLAGTYPNPSLAAGSVGSTEIQDGSIAYTDLSSGAVNSLMVDVQDEGVGVVTNATVVNFVGAGVTASGAGSVGTVTIPGTTFAVTDTASVDLTLTGSPSAGYTLSAVAAAGAGTTFAVTDTATIDLTLTGNPSAGYTLSAASLVGTWQNYTPALTSFSLGAGSISGRYTVIGKTVHWEALATLGTGFSVGANPTISTPVAVRILSGGTSYETLNVKYVSSGSNTFQGAGVYGNTVALGFVAGTNGAFTGTTTTVPFAWKVNDVIAMSGTYETT